MRSTPLSSYADRRGGVARNGMMKLIWIRLNSKMGTRYGRRARDGTTEYYDSKDALVAAAEREEAARMANFFTAIGLLAGGVAAYYLLHRTGAAMWPKPGRVFVVVGSAVGSALLLRTVGRYLIMLVVMLLLVGLLLTIGRWLWQIA